MSDFQPPRLDQTEWPLSAIIDLENEVKVLRAELASYRKGYTNLADSGLAAIAERDSLRAIVAKSKTFLNAYLHRVTADLFPVKDPNALAKEVEACESFRAALAAASRGPT